MTRPRNKKTGSLTSLAVASALLSDASVPCDISGRDASLAAASNGYSFLALKTGGQGSCESQSTPWVLRLNAGDMDGISCSYLLFGGFSLRSPWKLQAAVFSGAYQYVANPGWGTESAELRIIGIAPASTTLFIRLESLRLVGGDCRDWKEAFSAPV